MVCCGVRIVTCRGVLIVLCCPGRLVCCGVRILKMLETAAQSRLSDALSPEVTCTTLWFLQRVTHTYLMPNENYYTVVS